MDPFILSHTPFRKIFSKNALITLALSSIVVSLAMFGFQNEIAISLTNRGDFGLDTSYLAAISEKENAIKLQALALLVVGISSMIFLYLNDPHLFYEPSTIEEKKFIFSDQHLAVHTIDRLKTEINRLSKNAILNLILGTVITAIGLIYLMYAAFQSTSFDKPMAFMSHYLPKLSIIILIEVFAFFFLRIYKANLADIKFFNNELTSVEMRLLAVSISQSSGEAALLSTCVDRLLSVERNIVLKAGESTIELEREKIESASHKELISALKEVIASKAKS